ncbi:hypothetical protein EXIGLDRAFT_844199 [Exidia glandulosa HHB12029]|uniref:Extracellular membrane protein CFEM domain-containing protein n=1 Tax=Exidia glandulosa HHB12029 TaxID=1314781 RepID=A0A165C631_EXIGL|nr:hypothetical protein EXIGLDRAFT_844199 [Exidia glandulosa HHB12029]
MCFSVLLVAVAISFASAQASSSLFGRATDPSACASDCGAQSQVYIEHSRCRHQVHDSGGDSTKLQICVCSSPSLVQGVNDCMQKDCPDDAHLFQEGCDIITAKASSTPFYSASTADASGTGCVGLVGFAAGVASSSVLFASVLQYGDMGV